MKTVTMLDGQPLPVLGLGTWGYGGGNTADYSRDAESIATLRRLIEMGYTHLDTAESYGKNHCEEVVGQAIKAFDVVAVMTGGGPVYPASATYVYHLYQLAFRNFRGGYASAFAMLFFVAIILITIFQLRISDKWVHYGE